MLQILPMENREKEAEILKTVPSKGGEKRVLEMTDGGNAVGWAATELDKGVLRITKLNVFGYDTLFKPEGEHLLFLDLLVRACASYGENHGAGFIETSFPDFHDFFKSRKFDTDETHAFTPMNTIVKYE